MRCWERNGCAVHTELPFRFSVIYTSKGYPFPDTLYTRAQALEIMEYGLEHLSMAQRSYTKNDYFNLIRYIIQIK